MKQVIFFCMTLPLFSGKGADQLPQGMVATFAGGQVTKAEYSTFLYQALGQSRLEEMVELKLLRQRAAELKLTPLAEDIATRVQAEKQKLLSRRYGGDVKLMKETMLTQGYSLAEMAAWMTLDLEKRILQERLIRAGRQLTDKAIKREFERLYGLDGIRVRVRQIQVSFGPFIEKELAKNKSIGEINRQELEKKVMARGMAIRQRLDKGEAFGLVCGQETDDPVARAAGLDPKQRADAGLVENYNYQRYGTEFATAVRGLKKGEIAGPIPFRSEGNLISCHLIKLEERTTTRLENVKKTVIEKIKQAEVNFYEQLGLKQKLFVRYKVITRKSGNAGEKH